MFNNLRAAKDIGEETFDLLVSEPDPRDQFLQQLQNSTLKDAVQMQLMFDISRSIAIAYQHLLEKFLHLLTNQVPMPQNVYLIHAHHNLDVYQLKIFSSHLQPGAL